MENGLKLCLLNIERVSQKLQMIDRRILTNRHDA